MYDDGELTYSLDEHVSTINYIQHVKLNVFNSAKRLRRHGGNCSITIVKREIKSIGVYVKALNSDRHLYCVAQCSFSISITAFLEV